ncbi:hypothetical protein CNMCM6936_005227 [Aspergillus lentulus]|nr:hypothetical protein CNMCM6936_005227 [Aspergillus lentulus]
MLRFWPPLRVPSPVSQHLRIPFSSRRRLFNVGSKPSTLSPHSLPDGGSGKPVPPHDPYMYTSGRWLHRDELERRSRQIVFDFSALRERAISLCPGATDIVKCEKREGGFNRVFLFTMDTGPCVVARLPTGIAGPSRLTTNSEVATMTYLQSKISVPIPKILDWSDDSSNPIGAEYIFQEHVAGVQLHQMWPKMDSEQHMLCTKMLALAMRDMASLDFPAYGSLYFSDAPLELHMKIPFEQGFCVGPHCNPVFWNRNPGNLDSTVVRVPIAVLRIQDAATPALLHPDFHKRNIYVSAEDPTVITGVLDWQSASIEPAFIYANETPDFAALPEEADGNIFENSHEEHKDPARKERECKDALICYQTYDVCMKGLAPKLRPARLLDPTLFRVFHYCHTTWRDSATALRQELIELSARWTELGLQDACPFSPNEEELKKHARDYEDFETVQKLKLWLRNSLHTNSDGWVPNDVWNAAKDAHRAAYDEWMQTARESEARGEGLTVAKADKLWPFDAR